MPSKDILSISQFQIVDSDNQTQLYPRAYALPQFFTTNLVHDQRIVKIFTGQNALIRAFYFNYMKLALQSEDSLEYISLLKEKFIIFDVIQEGQLQDKFLSDFQYRKFFKDFIQLAKQQYTPNFQSTAKKYPIIDKILQKLFKTIVPIGLFFADDEQKGASAFEIATQVIQYLCQEFEEEFSIEIPKKCFKFEPIDMYLYFQSMNEVYIAYIDDMEENKQKINKFESSDKSSFVCGQGNSFTSKFKQKNSQSSNAKHPFRKITLKTQISSLPEKIQKQYKKTQSFYVMEGSIKNNLNVNDSDSFQKSDKSNLLQSKGNLIRRRSRNSTLSNDHQRSLIVQPVSCYQYEQQNITKDQEQSTEQKSSQDDKQQDRQRANTLINILDSRVSEVEKAGSINLPFNMIDRTSQISHIITRRKQNRSLIHKNSFNQELQLRLNDQISAYTFQSYEKNVVKQPLIAKYQIQSPIMLPTPFVPAVHISDQPAQSTLQNNYSGNFSNYNLKNTILQMEEIIELGQDQDSQFTIKEFCQIESQDFSHSQKTVNLSDNISHKLMIEKIESRNMNISKTSIGQSLSSPNKMQKYSFFEGQDQQKQNSQLNNQLQKSVDYRNQTKKNQSQKQSFQQFMKSMKERLPLVEQSKNSEELPVQFISKKIYINLQNKPSYLDCNPKFESHVKFNEQAVKQSRDRADHDQTPSYEMSWLPGSSDGFTKSDILLLLDEEYRSKIRAIKNEYKSTIRQDHNSILKQNWKSAIQTQNRSFLKESNKQKPYNEYNSLLKQNYQVNRSRQTSIYVEEK